MTRLPLQPLIDHLGLRGGHHVHETGWRNGGTLTVPITPARQLADLIGVARVTVARWQRHGLTVWQADRAAVACGLHPIHVWGEAWERADGRVRA